MSATHFVTVSGRIVDLYEPKAESIDFEDIAEHLAKEARYGGATPGVIYFVAQHVCLGADWIIESEQRAGLFSMDLGDARLLLGSNPARLLAAYFLSHDDEEGYLGDDTTPKKRAIERVAQEFGAAAGSISDAYARLVERHNRLIHQAAGLAWPPPNEIERAVKQIDLRMLVTEWLQLRPNHPLPEKYHGIEPLPITIKPWTWEVAKQELLIRMEELLPVFGRKAKEVAFG